MFNQYNRYKAEYWVPTLYDGSFNTWSMRLFDSIGGTEGFGWGARAVIFI